MSDWSIITAHGATDLDSLGLIVTDVSHAGVAAVNPLRTAYKQADGSHYQQTRIQPRSLIFHLALAAEDVSLAALHAARIALIQVVQPHQADGGTLTIRYTGGSEPVELTGRYDGGLEFAGYAGTVEPITLRLYCADPYWYGSTKQINITGSGGRGYSSLARLDPGFGWMPGTGAPAAASPSFESYCLRPASPYRTADPGMYVASNLGVYYETGTENGSSPAWVSVGASDGPVYALLVEPNGDLIAGGDFTQIGGVNALNLAWYDVSEGVWSEAWGGGANGTVRVLETDPFGRYWIGGDFTTIAGATIGRVGRLDSSRIWQPIGTLTWDNSVYCMAFDFAGQALIGGSFHDVSGTTDDGFGRLGLDDATWEPLATLPSVSCVRSVAVAHDEAIWVGGISPNDTAQNHHAYLYVGDGSAWVCYLSLWPCQFSPGIGAVRVAATGAVYVQVNQINWSPVGETWGAHTFYGAVYDRGQWQPITFPERGQTLAWDAVGRLHTGMTMRRLVAAGTSSVTVTGDAVVSPTVACAYGEDLQDGIVTLHQHTTGAFACLVLQASAWHTVYVDFSQQTMTVEPRTDEGIRPDLINVDHNTMGVMRSYSTLGLWVLLPGVNYTELRCMGKSPWEGQTYLVWRERYWSYDV